MGITISYVIGRMIGPPGILKLGRLLHWKADHVERVEQWVRRWGSYVMLFAYFLPGVRHVGALLIGISTVTFWTFARFAYAGAIIWIGTFVSLGYLLGEEWSRFSVLVHRSAVVIAITASLLAIAAIAIWKKRLNRQTASSEGK